MKRFHKIGSLEISEDIAFQGAFWKFERFIHVTMVIVVVFGILGFLL